MAHRSISRTLCVAIMISALVLVAVPTAHALPATQQPEASPQKTEQGHQGWLTALWDFVEGYWKQIGTGPGPYGDPDANVSSEGDPGDEGAGPAIDPTGNPSPGTN